MKLRSLRLRSSAALLFALGACSVRTAPATAPAAGPTAAPIVTGMQNQVIRAPALSVAPSTAGDPTAVVSTVTFDKSQILGRTFLYGADLQYSGINDGSMTQSQSTSANGHVPATFRILSGNLELVQDQTSLFESNVNHPERLIFQLPIVSETDTSIAVKIDRGSPQLATFASDDNAPAPRSSWVRSVNFAADSQLLLVESSIEGSDGMVYEFMESLFPRDQLVPAGYVPLEADDVRQADLTGRYHFITGGQVWVDDPKDGRVQTQYAARFNRAPGQTIDWYVTSNIPDEFVPEIQLGIEGWNRYSQKMWQRDIVHFVGKLPDGVKVGDPRYNVVVWDSVPDAGAAWESQATDPLTGIASHALIYLPYAWFVYGQQYWDGGNLSQGDAPPNPVFDVPGRTFLGRPVKVGCYETLGAVVPPPPTTDRDEFAKTLVKTTLFHEAGHALGYGHNFRGSMTYDMVNWQTFTSSVMDYNLYDLDHWSFTALDSSDGPSLEYDRQLLSVIYNGGKDVAATDPVLPMCTDEEVPSARASGAVDPFCQQYDGGDDPSAYLAMNMALVTDAAAKLGPIESLPSALSRAAARLPDPTTIATMDDAKAAILAQKTVLTETVNYYVSSRLGKLSRPTRFMLGEFTGGALASGVNADDVRSRVYSVLELLATISSLPDASKTALASAINDTTAWFEKTPAFSSLPTAMQPASETDATSPLATLESELEASFTATRTAALATQAYSPTLSYHFATTPVPVDYEAKVVTLLANSVSATIDGAARPNAERANAATQLATFAPTANGAAALATVKTELSAELLAATTTDARTEARALLSLLAGGGASSSTGRKH